jgi:Homeodomain-like domain
VPAKIHRIKLSENERQDLMNIRDQKHSNTNRIKRAIALLLADEGPLGPAQKDAQICLSIGGTPRTIERLRERCCEVGPIGALSPKPRETPAREIKITGEVEARITQLACSNPPAGHARWTLRLLANHLVEIEVIESISHQSVRMVLKKVKSNQGVRNAGVFRQSRTLPL